MYFTEVIREKFLAHISTKIGSEWLLLCASLGVQEADLDHINYDASLAGPAKIYKGLLCWRKLKKGASEDELITELMDALKEIGRQDLVQVALREILVKIAKVIIF